MEDSKPCASVSEEIKNLIIKIVAEVKHTSLKRRNIIDEDDEESGSVEGGHTLFGFKGKQTVATISRGNPSNYKSNDKKRIQRS